MWTVTSTTKIENKSSTAASSNLSTITNHLIFVYYYYCYCQAVAATAKQ